MRRWVALWPLSSSEAIEVRWLRSHTARDLDDAQGHYYRAI